MLHDDINDPRTFERFLREQGFSRNRAKAITAKGFRNTSIHDLVDQETELVSMLMEKKRLLLDYVANNGGLELEQKNILDKITRFLGITRPWANHVELFPGETIKDIVILPVSPGKVTFSVTPPSSARDARFTCTIKTFKFVGDEIRRHRETLTQNRLTARVDRGIRRSLFPKVSERDLLNYLERLGRNLFNGTTTAEFTFKDYGPNNPKNESGERARFLIRAKNQAVSDSTRIRRLREQLASGKLI